MVFRNEFSIFPQQRTWSCCCCCCGLPLPFNGPNPNRRQTGPRFRLSVIGESLVIYHKPDRGGATVGNWAAYISASVRQRRKIMSHSPCWKTFAVFSCGENVWPVVGMMVEGWEKKCSNNTRPNHSHFTPGTRTMAWH